MRFHFFYSKYIEELYLIRLFQDEDPLGLKNRAAQLSFPYDLALSIHQEEMIKWRSHLRQEINEQYKKHQEKIENSILFSKIYWEKNEQKWLPPLEQVLRKKIPDYHILLSQYGMGISDWYGTNISIPAAFSTKKNEREHIYALLYEVLLSQIFIKIRTQYSENILTDREVWKLSELSTFTILHNTFNCFFDKEKTFYVEVDNLLEKGQLLYLENQDIDIFLKNLISLIKGKYAL